jgi:predicted alpha/beta hydrolase family esterase
MPQPTVLFVPGLREHMPDHWQTLLQERLPKAVCVPRIRADKLSCAAWVEALDRTLRMIEGPVVLAAHSAGVMMVVHWAMKHRRPIEGALLATPADLEVPLPEGYPTRDELARNDWTPIPREPLPFPSIVAASINDPLARLDRIAELAQEWGSLLVNAGAVGHLNPASGFGMWPQAIDLLAQFGVHAESPETPVQ